jgi:hypothetical protein
MMQTTTRFPDRLYHVMWRNWDLLSAARLAHLLKCSASDVRRLAADFGLGAQPQDLAENRRRYRSLVIRRNWHLLPVSQIAALVGIEEVGLERFMREDDFLDVKLPPKPRCRPLEYHVPSPSARQMARRMAEALSALPEPSSVEPSFAFLKTLRQGRGDVIPARVSATERWALAPRIMHPYDTPHNATAFDPGNTPVAYLRLLREFGADALWFPAVVFNLVRLPGYPEFGRDRRALLPKLRRLIERMDQAGLKLYLYICEPRGQTEAFFRRHPNLRGVRARHDPRLYHICTSTPEGQRLVRASLSALCRSLPGLAGVIDISASEYPSHCCSHGYGGECPRCGGRRPADVLAELFRLMQDGIKDSGRKVELIAWNWGWQCALNSGESPKKTDILEMPLAPDARSYIFTRLPGKVIPLLNFEYGTRVRRGATEERVWEYAISQPIEGPYTAVQRRALEKLGRKSLARIHISNSTEYLGAPYVPVLHLVAEKIADVRRRGYQGFMGSWIFGGYPSPNLLAARELSRTSERAPGDVLRAVAGLYYGDENAAIVVRAWKLFSDAFRRYPFSITFQYNSPLHVAPAVGWSLKPTGVPSRIFYPSDDPDKYCAPYGPGVVQDTLERISDDWSKGLTVLQQALRRTDAAHRRAAQRDYGVAEAFGLCSRSLVNHIRFCSLREKSASSAGARERLRALVADEMQRATRYYQLMRSDSRIAFEASMQYFVLPNDAREKILGLYQILGELDKMDSSQTDKEQER